MSHGKVNSLKHATFTMSVDLVLVCICLFFLKKVILNFLMFLPPSPASLPGMWDRTITVGSAGKTFSVTGWKVRNGGKSNAAHTTSLSATSCSTVYLFRLSFFAFPRLKAGLVHRTRALDQTSPDRHAEHSVHLPDPSAGECASPLLQLRRVPS